MATLPTLRPGAVNTTGLPTTGSIILNPGGATALSDDSDTTFDGQNTNTSGTYQHGRELGNTPADFASILTCSIQHRRAWASAVSLSTWNSMSARIMASDGTTVLAASTSGGAFQTISSSITVTTPTLSSTVAFSYVNTGATKTQWDGAIVQSQWVRTRTKGGDAVGARLYETFVTGTYTAGVAGVTGTSTKTELADTASASGTVTEPAITGTVSVTEAADTSTASGTVPGSYPFVWPLTNLPAKWGGSFTGPVQDSNGNLYVLVQTSAAVPDAEMWKSTDDGVTFTLADVDLDALRDCKAAWIEPIPGRTDELMVATIRSSGTDVRTKRFGMSGHATSADAYFGTVEFVENDPLANDRCLSIAAWDTGAKLLAVYGGLNATTFDEIRYNTFDGTTNLWGTPAKVMTKASTNFQGAFVVAGASGKVYIFYADTTNNTIEMKSITAGGTLSEASTVDGTQVNTNSVTVKNAILSPIICRPVYYDDAGTEVIQVVWIDNSNKLWMNEVRGGTVGSTPIQVSTRSVQFDYVTATSNESAAGTMAVQGKTVHVFFGDLTNGDMYHAASDNFGTFPTEDLAIGSLSVNSQMSSAVIDIGGTDYVGLFFQTGDEAIAQDNDIHFNVYELPAAGFSGTATPTEQADTATASGTVTEPPTTGTVTATEQADTSTASGTVTEPPITGTATPTEQADTATASGTHTPPGFSGTATPTEQADTSTGSGTVTEPAITGTSTTTESADTSTASGTVTEPAITGTVAATEQADTANATGSAITGFGGTATPVEQADTATASGTVVEPAITGTATPSETADTANGSGTVTQPGITGTVAVTEAADTGNATGTTSGAAAITGTVAVTQSADTATATGQHTEPAITGTVAVIELADTGTATGTVTEPAITGTVAVTEQADTSTGQGTDGTEPPITGFVGSYGSYGNGYAGTYLEQADTATASGTVIEPRDRTEGHRIASGSREGHRVSTGSLEGSTYVPN